MSRIGAGPREAAGWWKRRPAVCVGVLGATLAACAGENLFTVPTTGGAVGPTVEITVPQDNFAVAVGEPVLVTVNVASTLGVTEVRFVGVSTVGAGDRFPDVIVALPSPQDTTISRTLEPNTLTTVEEVDIVVEATDLLGETATDRVTIQVGS